MKDNSFLVESVKRLLRRGATAHLHNMLQKVHPADLAEAFKTLDEDDRSAAFRILAQRATDAAAGLLVETLPASRPVLLRGMDSETIAHVLQQLPDDDVAEILSICEEDDQEQILASMHREASEEVKERLDYDEETAGRIMTSRFLALPGETLVQEAIAAVQKAQEAEMVFYLYVIGSQGHLEGVLSLRRLLTVQSTTRLREIMSNDVISVRVDTDQEEVARIASRYDLLAVPVVDEDNVLAGIVTIDDVIDVMREEATEDFYKLAGTSEEERTMKSTLRSAGVRLPWLFAAFIGGLLAAFLIKGYAPLLTRMVTLACFIPVILGMGGNIGTQAATIMVRGLSTGRVTLRQVGRLIFKEIRIALLLGLVYGVLLAVAAVLLIGVNRLAGFMVGVSLLVSMAVAAVLGATLPILLKAVHLDPAVATSPFVTTSVDLMGILAFFGLAGRYLLTG